MRNALTLFLIFFVFIIQACGQEESLDIKYEEINFTLIAKSNIYPETITKVINGNEKLEITVFNKLGKCTFKIYGDKGNLKQLGEFKESLGILASYMADEDLNTGDLTYYRYEYYQPIPTGIWELYNDDGTIKTIKY